MKRLQVTAPLGSISTISGVDDTVVVRAYHNCMVTDKLLFFLFLCPNEILKRTKK